MVFGSREMVSGHRSMVLPGSDMPSALGLVSHTSAPLPVMVSIYVVVLNCALVLGCAMVFG